MENVLAFVVRVIKVDVPKAVSGMAVEILVVLMAEVVVEVITDSVERVFLVDVLNVFEGIVYDIVVVLVLVV